MNASRISARRASSWKKPHTWAPISTAPPTPRDTSWCTCSFNRDGGPAGWVPAGRKPDRFLASGIEEPGAQVWLSHRHWGASPASPRQHEDDVSILGNRVRRREDPAFL